MKHSESERACMITLLISKNIFENAWLPSKFSKIKPFENFPLYGIIHGRVKAFLKAILQYKNEAPSLQKWVWHMHNKIVVINAMSQVIMQILLYNKKWIKI